MQWPPQLADVKRDLTIPDDDTRDDAALADQLAAAIAWVSERKADASGIYLPGPDASDVALGTARLAGRWFARRRSPDGTVAMGDLGTATVPGFDSDIERLLSLGRYGPSLIV